MLTVFLQTLLESINVGRVGIGGAIHKNWGRVGWVASLDPNVWDLVCAILHLVWADTLVSRNASLCSFGDSGHLAHQTAAYM